MRKPQRHSARPSDADYLDGHVLIASPAMSDPRFARAVIYLVAHSAEGAMGIVVNQRAPNISFVKLLQQLDIVEEADRIVLPGGAHDMAVHIGGPVDKSRGFVLHSPDYFVSNSTLKIAGDICLTATIDILKALATGKGPNQALMALGYAGWGAGQLEDEIRGNGWLHCTADPELIFAADLETKYDLAFARLGVNPSFLVNDAGHA